MSHSTTSTLTTVFILSLCLFLLPEITGDFEHRENYDTGDGPHEARLADLDDDGDLDCVTADYNDDTVSILLNDGEGVFTKENWYQVGNGPRALFCSDVDSDSDIDIVTANFHNDTVSVLKNNGDATFASNIEYDVGEGPFSIYLTDIGEDTNADLDIITADEQGDKVSVLENDGDGTFQNHKTYNVGTRPKGIFATDLDDDGYNDITTSNWVDDTVSVLINKGDGTFKNQVTYDTGDAPRSIFMANIDNDNMPDIVTADQYSNSTSIIFNNGDGTFGSKVDYIVGDNPLSVFLGDIDDDGDCDIFTASLKNNTITVLKNDGSGNFFNRIDYNTGWGPYSVVLGDVNDDGEVDIVSASNYDDAISVLYSNYPPLINILEPDGVNDMADTSFMITWEDYDPYDDATITLYWDDDNENYDGSEITAGISEDEDGIGGFFSWNITEIPDGDYWIYAIITDDIFESRNDYSAGPLTVNHSVVPNTSPTFQIVEPDGNGDYADFEFTIMWMDSDPDDDASISLYYDMDDFGYDGIPIVEGLGEDEDGGSGFHTWNTSEITEGQYYIYGICTDGINEPVLRYSSYPVIIDHTPSTNDLPFIEILEPDGEDDSANTEYMITWMDSDDDDNAFISLYYDVDSSGYDGVLIASGLSEDEHGNSGAYIWNTTQISAGEYYIYAYISDESADAYHYSPGKINIDHTTTSNVKPSFQITEPDGKNDYANSDFTIMWMDSDPDDDASISLYYDSDKSGFDGILIISGLSEDANGDSGIYNWNTTAIQEGEYYIYGVCDDGNNKAVKRYSYYPLNINHTTDPSPIDPGPSKNNPPLIQIVDPDGKNDGANTEYMITWIDSDNDDDASISLYYCLSPSDLGRILIISGLSEDEHGNSGIYIWNTTQIPVGDYFIYAEIDDGIETSRDYSPGYISIIHSQTFNAAPKILILTPEKGTETVDESYIIKWIDSDPDDNAYISLYYDTDQNGYDGILIVSNLSEDDESDTYIWNTKNMSDGNYYIYAIIDDNNNDAAYDYSDGVLRIDHMPDGEKGEGDDEKEELWSTQNILYLILAIVLILLLVVFISKRGKKTGGEEETEDEEFGESGKESPQPEDLEEDIDEELLPPPDDFEDIDEELLPPPEDF